MTIQVSGRLFQRWGLLGKLTHDLPHPEEIFPVRQAWIGSGQYEDYFPSDLYYADIYDSEMQFSDWDANDDGKYAEYRNPNSNDI